MLRGVVGAALLALGRRLADVLAPPGCVGCGRLLATGGTLPGALPLCDACRRRFARERALAAVVGDRGRLPIAAACVYGPVARALVARFKFAGGHALAPPLASAMLPAVRELTTVLRSDGARSGMDVRCALTPVPTHPWRKRARGYDQAELLARSLADIAGLPALDLLRRRGPLRPQRRRGRRDRLALPGDVFVVRRPPPPLALLLVDDVATTGATLSAAAATLAARGALLAGAVVFARAVRSRDRTASLGELASRRTLAPSRRASTIAFEGTHSETGGPGCGSR